MSLARRVRDYRFAKGWGPDELSSRASISRTALYQIESGKTELPRAATLQRIAHALGVSMEVLLEDIARPVEFGGHGRPSGPAIRGLTLRRDDEMPAAVGAIGNGPYDSLPGSTISLGQHGSRFAPPAQALPDGRAQADDSAELERKFRELLDSPLGHGLARLVEDTHRLLMTAE